MYSLHGAVNGWFILEIVPMSIFQNVATGDISVIGLQFSEVQPFLSLHISSLDYDMHACHVQYR